MPNIKRLSLFVHINTSFQIILMINIIYHSFHSGSSILLVKIYKSLKYFYKYCISYFRLKIMSQQKKNICIVFHLRVSVFIFYSASSILEKFGPFFRFNPINLLIIFFLFQIKNCNLFTIEHCLTWKIQILGHKVYKIWFYQGESEKAFATKGQAWFHNHEFKTSNYHILRSYLTVNVYLVIRFISFMKHSKI